MSINIPALEFSSDAVELDTHWVVWVHDDLVNECLDSLVEESKNKILKLLTDKVYINVNILTHLVDVTTFFLISSW